MTPEMSEFTIKRLAFTVKDENGAGMTIAPSGFADGGKSVEEKTVKELIKQLKTDIIPGTVEYIETPVQLEVTITLTVGDREIMEEEEGEALSPEELLALIGEQDDE